MQTIRLFLFAFLGCLSLHGQKTKDAVYIAGGFASFSPQHAGVNADLTTENGSRIGWSTGIGFQKGWQLSKGIVLASEVGYLHFQSSLTTNCYCSSPGIAWLRHDLSSHAVEVPLFLKVNLKKTNRNTLYAHGGVGGNWIFSASRSIEEIGSKSLQEDDFYEVTVNERENTSLKTFGRHDFGFFYRMGIGNQFTVYSKSIHLELLFQNDFTPRQYSVDREGSSSLNIRQLMFLLRIGISL